MLAQKPVDENDRLAELHSFGVLDTGPDPAFDEVVDLLATMLDMPVALISLVDENRQWFKARHGFDASETPLSQSICSHAILSDGILEIEDTHLDLRTSDNPFCCGILAEMRYYAGAPLMTRSGHRIGTLCVLDRVPRRLSEQQRKLIDVMARQVMRQLDLQRALTLKEVLRSEIDHRVKNSLQTVASTIRLYRGRAKTEETVSALDAIQRRVDAISQLHAELNLTSKTHHVRLDTYMERVALLLQQQGTGGLAVVSDVPGIEVESRVAASIGVIANEFAANAAKYAFSEDMKGAELRFEAVRTGPNRLTFTCRDNGSGSARTADDLLISTSLGARLMQAAAEQVGGTLFQERGDAGFMLKADLPLGPGLSPEEAREAVPAAV